MLYINNIPIEKINTHQLRKDKIGYVEQSPVYGDYQLSNILDHVFKEDYSKVAQTFALKYNISTEFFHIDDLMPFKFGELSQGQRQQLAIIIALLKDPDLLILDEPTSALDRYKKVQLMKILESLAREKICLLISHDSVVLEGHCQLIHLE